MRQLGNGTGCALHLFVLFEHTTKGFKMKLSSYLILYIIADQNGYTTIAYFGMFLAVLEFLRLCTEKSEKRAQET